MTQIGMQDVANYAYAAGFRGNDLVIATAVGWAESRGITDAVSTDGYGSHGIWQFIPSTWASTTNNSPFVNADNPQASANAAFAIWQKQGFRPWSTYNNRAYTAFIISDGQGGIGAQKAASVVTKTPIKPGDLVTQKQLDAGGGGIQGQFATGAKDLPGVKTLADLLALVNKLVHFVSDSNNWIRVAEFGAGLILLLMGLYRLAMTTNAGTAVVKAVGNTAKTAGEAVVAA